MAEKGLTCCLIVLSSLLVLQMNVNFTLAKRRISKTHNNIIDVKAECSITSMNVTLRMEQQFQGVVYARGFPLGCRALGSRENSVTLHLPASGCGVRITPNKEGGLLYSVVVEVQMAKHLQQVSDLVMPVNCALSEEKMVLTSHAIHLDKPKSRASRMMQDEEVLGPRAWLEIQGSAPPRSPDALNTVSVGEHTTVLVKTWLPENISSQVVDCLAHDGLGETSQALIDTAGCPVDEVLVPKLRESGELAQTQGFYRFTVQATSFPAFKFPDRDSVHLRCGLQLCRGSCQQVDCSSDVRSRHRQQRKIKGEDGEVLDYIQLFNSVEVLAPGIEMDNLRHGSRFHSSGNRNGPLPADLLSEELTEQPFCLSASRMAVGFAALGTIFLAAVAVSLYVLLRNRLLHQAPVYTSDPRDSLSLILGQNSRSSLSAWSYGRI